MAPEVILHGKYDHRLDVFSFAIVLWEACSSQLPYSDMAPIAAATAVATRGLRPPLTPECLPPACPPDLVALIELAWHAQPAKRPEFAALAEQLGALRARQEPRDPSQLSAGEGPSSDTPSVPSDGELLLLQDLSLEEAQAAEDSHWASAESGPMHGAHSAATAAIVAQSERVAPPGAADSGQRAAGRSRRGCGCFGRRGAE